MNMLEEWKDVIGYDSGYQVSNTGKIYSKKLRRVLNPPVDKDGYYRIGLWKNQKVVKYYLHRIVALHFIPNPENKPVVNHINGDKKDNRIENLEWNTVLENERHSRQILGKVVPAHGHKPVTLIKDSQELTFESVTMAIAFLKCSGSAWKQLTSRLKDSIKGYQIKIVEAE